MREVSDTLVVTFFATSHGKGPCDGIGGALKRNATRTSHQKLYTGHITTAKELFEWAVSKQSASAYRCCSEAEYKTIERKLNSRFNKVHAIEGTQKFHSYIPLDEKRIKASRFSTSQESHIFHLID